MNNISNFCFIIKMDLKNAFSEDYTKEHFKILDTKDKVLIGAITALVGVVTLPFFGLLAALAFKGLVRKFAAVRLHTENTKDLEKEIVQELKICEASPFIYLLAKGDKLNIDKLLKKGFDVNIPQDRYDFRPALHWAASFGNLEILELLLKDKKTDINATNKYGTTALQSAGPTLAKLKLLIDYGADVNIHYPLHSFLRDYASDDLEVAELLISKTDDINAKDYNGDTFLHLSARFTDTKILRFLLEKGCDANIPNDGGYTALHVAISESCNDAVKALLENGADANKKNENGRAALHTAISGKGGRDYYHDADLEMVESLLADSTNIDINLADNEGNTPLHLAVLKGQKDIVKVLLENGADANIMNTPYNYLPLHNLIQMGKNLTRRIVADRENRDENLNKETNDLLEIAEYLIPHTTNARAKRKAQEWREDLLPIMAKRTSSAG